MFSHVDFPVYRPAGETVIGYCYLRYRERHAYRFTVENSVYIDPAYQRQGRKSLTRSCLNMGPVSGIPPDDSGCGDSANVASVALHLRAGFTEIGTLKDIGFKHGRWLDTVLLQRQLGKGSCTLPDSPVPGR